jgi:hypothetical protein
MCKYFKSVFCSVFVNGLGVLEPPVQIGKSNGRELAGVATPWGEGCGRSPLRVGRDNNEY